MVLRPRRIRIFKYRLICNREYATAGLESVVAFAQWKQTMTKKQEKVVEEVVKQVNIYFQTDCKLKTRKMDVVRPRMYAVKIMRELTKLGYEELGNIFDVTHASAIHYIRTVDHDLATQSKFRKYYIELMTLVKGSNSFKSSGLNQDTTIDKVRFDVYEALMSKDLDQLNKIIKIIT